MARWYLQNRFAAAAAQQRAKKQMLDEIERTERQARPIDINLLDHLPTEDVDLGRLPEDQQRRIYDAFHLEMRYNALTNGLTIRITVTGDTVPALASTVGAVVAAHRNHKEPARPSSGEDPWIVCDAQRALPGALHRRHVSAGHP